MAPFWLELEHLLVLLEVWPLITCLVVTTTTRMKVATAEVAMADATAVEEAEGMMKGNSNSSSTLLSLSTPLSSSSSLCQAPLCPLLVEVGEEEEVQLVRGLTPSLCFCRMVLGKVA